MYTTRYSSSDNIYANYLQLVVSVEVGIVLAISGGVVGHGIHVISPELVDRLGLDVVVGVLLVESILNSLLVHRVVAELLQRGRGLLSGRGGVLRVLLGSLLVALLALANGTLRADEGGGIVGGLGALPTLDRDEALGAHHDGGDRVLGNALLLLENVALIANVVALGRHVLDAAIGHLMIALGAELLGGNDIARGALLAGDDAAARLVHGGLLGAHSGSGDGTDLGALALVLSGAGGAGEGRGLSNGLPALALSGLVALGAGRLALDDLDALALAGGLELLGAAVLGGDDLDGHALLALEISTLGTHGGGLGLLLHVAVAVLIDLLLALEGSDLILLASVLVLGGDDDLADAHLAAQNVALVTDSGGGGGLNDGAALALVVSLLGADNGLGGGLGAEAPAVTELTLLAVHGDGDLAHALLALKLEALVAGKNALHLLVRNALIAIELGTLGAGELGLDLIIRGTLLAGLLATILGLGGSLGASPL